MKKSMSLPNRSGVLFTVGYILLYKADKLTKAANDRQSNRGAFVKCLQKM